MDKTTELGEVNERISVIIPVYNVDQYLRKCLDSVVSQTYKNIEIIIINDGSTDLSGAICQEYAAKDKRIVYIDKENGGLSSARNVGLRWATGEYVSFIDSDDYIEDVFYDVMIRTIKGGKGSIVECGVSNVAFDFNERIPIEKATPIIIPPKEALKNMISHKGHIQPRYAVWNKLFDKRIIEGLFFPEGEVHEDYLFEAKAFMNSSEYIYVGERLYYHRTRPGSIITSSIFSDKHFDKIKHIRQRTDYFASIGENDLEECSVRDEFETLLLFYYLSVKAGKPEISKNIKSELHERKSSIFRCGYGFKRLLDFTVFFLAPKIFIKYMEIKQKISTE